MKIVKGDNAAAIDKDQINKFETFIGGKLPKDYKTFLLKYNGLQNKRLMLCVLSSWDEVQQSIIFLTLRKF